MATIYKLTIDDEQIGDICYNWDDAMLKCGLVFISSFKDVGVWGAKEIEGVHFDKMEWTKIMTYRA